MKEAPDWLIVVQLSPCCITSRGQRALVKQNRRIRGKILFYILCLACKSDGPMIVPCRTPLVLVFFSFQCILYTRHFTKTLLKPLLKIYLVWQSLGYALFPVFVKQTQIVIYIVISISCCCANHQKHTLDFSLHPCDVKIWIKNIPTTSLY